jgi:NodT family efflux transporter outer membrane factor (OMF) lipoprotein
MKNILLIGMSALVLTACSLVPEFNRPTVSTPAEWHDAELLGQKTAVDPQWWHAFGSTELNHLITESLLYNNDLAAASQRVEQARAQAKIAGAGLWPTVGLQGNFADTHNNKGDLQIETGQLTASYVVDLWGANRANRDAGSALLLSSVFAKDALQLVVMSNVGQAYFNLLATVELRRIASEFLDNTAQVLAIIEAQHQAGLVSALDLVQQQTQVATARANVDLLNQQTTLAENALAILLGRPPQQTPVKTELFFDIALPTINPLQPASLMERRPDVRQAEMQLVAANANIGVARAAFYPKLQLNFNALVASPQPAGLALAMASSLVQPLFQGGLLEGGLENAQARNAELVETYRKTILTAFKEVEDAAAVRSNSNLRLQALAEAVDKARQAYLLSVDRYRLGAINYQTLLNTQQSLLNAQNSQVQARQSVLIAMLQLYQALGGGWFQAATTP